MCERKFTSVKYIRPYRYANFGTVFSATRYLRCELSEFTRWSQKRH